MVAPTHTARDVATHTHMYNNNRLASPGRRAASCSRACKHHALLRKHTMARHNAATVHCTPIQAHPRHLERSQPRRAVVSVRASEHHCATTLVAITAALAAPTATGRGRELHIHSYTPAHAPAFAPNRTEHAVEPRGQHLYERTLCHPRTDTHNRITQTP